jgi:hypothetical protein
MKRIITIGIIVLATNAATAQKANEVPVNNGGTVEAQVKSHSNGNNNRQAGNSPKVGSVIPGTGGSGTKRKFDTGKWFRKK